MSLLRALRAYVGLGPDEEYEEHYLVDRTPAESSRVADGRRKDRPRSRGSYLDDYYGKGRPEARHDDVSEEIIDIRTARIEARRADGTVESTPRPANQSRTRISDPVSRRRRNLSENDELLERIPEGIPTDFSDEPPTDSVVESVGAQTDDDNSDTNHDREQGAVVRSIDSARSRPRTLHPESFSDAKHVADEFKRGTPVVVNLQDLERDLARRLIDFASGICYGLDGSMEKLAPQVFLLTPEGLTVSDTDRRRIEERGYAR